jgi:hypothetical protein
VAMTHQDGVAGAQDGHRTVVKHVLHRVIRS